MRLEVRNHDVRSSNELPGLPYISGQESGKAEALQTCS